MASFINSSDEEDQHADKMSSTQWNTTYFELPDFDVSDEDEDDEPDIENPVTSQDVGEEDVERIADDNNSNNRTYLITYSQANTELFTRETFGKACVAAFGGPDAVNYYCVGLEDHSDGGKHYHVSILLSKPQRWHAAQQHLSSHGAKVHFSTSGKMYAGAYFYATKEDKDYHQGSASEPHPRRNQIGSNSKAANANKTYRRSVFVC